MTSDLSDPRSTPQKPAQPLELALRIVLDDGETIEIWAPVGADEEE